MTLNMIKAAGVVGALTLAPVAGATNAVAFGPQSATDTAFSGFEIAQSMPGTNIRPHLENYGKTLVRRIRACRKLKRKIFTTRLVPAHREVLVRSFFRMGCHRLEQIRLSSSSQSAGPIAASTLASAVLVRSVRQRSLVPTLRSQRHTLIRQIEKCRYLKRKMVEEGHSTAGYRYIRWYAKAGCIRLANAGLI